ncbi:MAG: hypothetical protein H8E41_07295 [Desulfobulbaceae bacterium]|uniref:Uncharacterized protein n=1 Tax=Candidatus Desulfobia pelagia TaxID=2841692 RepID=A0A8J6NBB7_9BACT|nr:hypothetical protein [Candidatus Desulfobia pelagia]
MKKGILVTFILFSFLVGNAFGGTPNIVGEWNGEGSAIFPDGTVIELNIYGEILAQHNGLATGYFLFSFAENPAIEFQADFTGYIDKSNNLKGVMSSEGYGTGIADAKWSGNKIEGVALDLGDLSTTHFTVFKE